MAIHSHKIRSALITSLAVLVILVALVFSSFRLVVLLVSDYADDIEHEINQLLGVPVSIQKLDADIYWLSPRLKLLNVDFYDVSGKSFLHSDEINLSLNWLASLKSLRPELGVISLSGTDLDIERQLNGEFLIQGFPLKTSNSAQDIPLEAQRFLSHSSIFISNSRLQWRDQKSQQALTLSQVDLAMVNNINEHQLAISFDLPKKYGERLTLRAQLQGRLTRFETLSGKIYGQLKNINMQPWFADYGAVKGLTANGQLSGETWLSFEQKTIKQLSGQIQSKQLQLAISQSGDKHNLNIDELSTRLKWQQKNNGWQLQLDDVQVKRKEKKWPEHSSLSLAYQQSQNQLQLQASFLRSEDVLALTQFTSHYLKQYVKQPLSLVESYQLKGDFTQLSLFLPLDVPEQFNVSSHVNQLAFFEPQQNIQGSGFDGEIRARIDTAWLKLTTQQATLSISPLFRNKFNLTKLTGNVLAYKNKNNWLIETDNLLLDTPHFNSQTRFRFAVDEAFNIHSDLYSSFKNGDMANVGPYLPVAIMDDELTDWLDNSIKHGRLLNGAFILYGELNQFPFEKGEGVLEAAFNVNNASLKYLANWPQIDDMSANLLFTQKGMLISALQGRIATARITHADVTIDDFQQALLKIQGDVQGQAKEYINFIKHSELNDSLSYISQFETEGEASLKLAIDVPLDSDDEVSVAGKLKLEKNTLYIPSEKFRFEKMQGNLSFTESSVSAKELSATLDGYPLKINIDDIYKDKNHYTNISSQFKAPAKSLLVSVPELQAYFSGESLWNINIVIPISESEDIVNVQLSSDLKGVDSTLPAPFMKDSQVKTQFKFGLSVNNDEQLSLNVRMADDIKLSAKLINDQWNAAIDSKNIKGQASFSSDFDKDVVAKLRLSYLDVTPYMESSDEDIEIKPMNIPPLDVHIKKFKLKEMDFSDVNLQTSRNKNGMYIQQLNLNAKGVSARVKGSWMSSWRQKNHTQLKINLDFKDLGKCLKELKISQAIHKGKGKAELDWQWSAEPYAFNWDLLQGKGHFKIKDGRLNDVNAGAGRLLGVLNFKTLLSLDFGSQVSDGFPFDEAAGDVIFANGNAKVNKLSINSTVADVDITGRIGLSAEDLDQVFKVTPGVGSSLTLIGAVAGGPITAVWVHLFQKLFSVDEIAEYTYTVKGSWDDPQVKLISAPENNDTAEQELSDDQ